MNRVLRKQDLLNVEFASLSKKEIFKLLQTSNKGLSQSERILRLNEFGLNQFISKKHQSTLSIFMHEFSNPLVLILMSAVFFSLLSSEWLDAGLVSLILIFSAFLSFLQQQRAQIHLEKIFAKSQVYAQVLIDGNFVSIPLKECVPGDVVFVSAGSMIPGDGNVISAQHCYVNQSSLTGESLPVEKMVSTLKTKTSLIDQKNRVFLGTNVQSGNALICITQTGKNTEIGQISALIQSKIPKSDFEKGLNQFSYMLSRVIIIIVMAVFTLNLSQQKPLLDSVLFATALAVGIAPELLPAILNVTLSKGAQILAKKGLLVRRLNAIENMGSMQILCTDKTGTITQGELILKQSLNVDSQEDSSIEALATLNAYLQTGTKNPMDIAILKKQQLPIDEALKITEIPFDFNRKCLSIIIKDGLAQKIITKGAYDSVFKNCTTIKNRGEISFINHSLRETCYEIYRQLSLEGYRVLALATRMIDNNEKISLDSEKDLCFEGFLVFEDPLKEDVEEAIKQLKNKGVSVKIITGDNRYVASHVAHHLNLNHDSIITSDQLSRLTDDALCILAHQCDLFAEMDPIQKERVVRVLKSKYVVGYMGDGINDAPSLRISDVGISVDNAVEVAKEASDIVLLKQDINLVLEGIMEGRRIFSNTLKYVLMTISANFGNMISMAIASFFLPFLPLLAKQILLNNLLSDVPAIGMPDDHVDHEMIRKPLRWEIKSIQSFMIMFGLVSSFYDFLTFIILLFVFKSNQIQFQSAWFMESIFTELLIVFVIRTKKPFYKSKAGKRLVQLSILTSLIVVLIPYSFLGSIFDFTTLSLDYWLALAVILGLYILTVEKLKTWYYQRHSFSS